MHMRIHTFQYSLRIVGFCDFWPSLERYRSSDVFQYSLRIVGFCDGRCVASPCEFFRSHFQYSLRIVGFCDMPRHDRSLNHFRPFSIPCESWGSATLGRWTNDWMPYELSVFPANRGVLRQGDAEQGVVFTRDLSVFPANRGVLRRYSTRLIDASTSLSVFPANRGVLRHYRRSCSVFL